MEAADCSKAFIRRGSEGNNGIIVLDDGCLSRCYLRRPANFCWHQADSAWQPRRCHVVSVCVCVCDEVCVGISSRSVRESLLQEWACARGFGVRAFGREAAKLHHVFWMPIVPETEQDDANYISPSSISTPASLNPTAPRLIQFFAYESFLVHVFISETLSLPFLVIRRLQLSIVGKVEEEENR